jgi:hypothetical protein
MRLLVALVLALASLGCGATTADEARPLIAADRRPEERPLPPDPREEDIPEGYDTKLSEEHIEALEAGSCIAPDGVARSKGPCPSWSGIAVSEARAARDGMIRSRYKELRSVYQSDRRVWSAQREMYEAQVRRDREEIERLHPSWWEEHDGTILTAVGLVVGAAITIAITFAVEEATE